MSFFFLALSVKFFHFGLRSGLYKSDQTWYLREDDGNGMMKMRMMTRDVLGLTHIRNQEHLFPRYVRHAGWCMALNNYKMDYEGK